MDNNEIDAISKELSIKYDITHNESFMILINTISAVYNTEHPIIIKDDGAYLTFEDKDRFLTFSKIIFSQKKSRQIINRLQENALKCFLQKSKISIVDSLKNRKKYLYCAYSYSCDKYDYYNLFFDKKLNKIIKYSEAIFKTSVTKKQRIYIDINSATIVQNKIQYREYKKFVNLQNITALTKEISKEVYDKINIKIWIEVKGFNFAKKEVYLYLPHKTLLSIIEFIELKYKEIFGLTTVLIIGKKNES